MANIVGDKHVRSSENITLTHKVATGTKTDDIDNTSLGFEDA